MKRTLLSLGACAMLLACQQTNECKKERCKEERPCDKESMYEQNKTRGMQEGQVSEKKNDAETPAATPLAQETSVSK